MTAVKCTGLPKIEWNWSNLSSHSALNVCNMGEGQTTLGQMLPFGPVATFGPVAISISRRVCHLSSMSTIVIVLKGGVVMLPLGKLTYTLHTACAKGTKNEAGPKGRN